MVDILLCASEISMDLYNILHLQGGLHVEEVLHDLSLLAAELWRIHRVRCLSCQIQNLL